MGNSAALMRYTEARLSPIASELLRILIKKQLNSCQTLMIRVKNRLYYQQLFLNLLVNGSTGISAGYATEIPPHHLGEVIDATMMRIDKPNSTVDDLLTVMK